MPEVIEERDEQKRRLRTLGRERLAYDHEFQPAIDEGFLSISQAATRGSRAAMAQRLVRQHGMTLELALRVADNRITVSQARCPDSAVPATPAAAYVAESGGRRGWVVAAVLLVGLAFGAHVLSQRSHLRRAQSLVESFAHGKDPRTIDYSHPTYASALEELAQVVPWSLYGEPARAMREEIEREMAGFLRRVSAAQQEVAKGLERRQQRREAFTTARRTARLAATDAAPECENHPAANREIALPR